MVAGASCKALGQRDAGRKTGQKGGDTPRAPEYAPKSGEKGPLRLDLLRARTGQRHPCPIPGPDRPSCGLLGYPWSPSDVRPARPQGDLWEGAGTRRERALPGCRAVNQPQRDKCAAPGAFQRLRPGRRVYARRLLTARPAARSALLLDRGSFAFPVPARAASALVLGWGVRPAEAFELCQGAQVSLRGHP